MHTDLADMSLSLLPPNSASPCVMIHLGGYNCSVCHMQSSECMGVCENRTVVTARMNHDMI